MRNISIESDGPQKIQSKWVGESRTSAELTVLGESIPINGTFGQFVQSLRPFAVDQHEEVASDPNRFIERKSGTYSRELPLKLLFNFSIYSGFIEHDKVYHVPSCAVST